MGANNGAPPAALPDKPTPRRPPWDSDARAGERGRSCVEVPKSRNDGAPTFPLLSGSRPLAEEPPLYFDAENYDEIRTPKGGYKIIRKPTAPPEAPFSLLDDALTDGE
jgi:hypothetical protein